MNIILSTVFLIIGFVVLWLSSNKAIIYSAQTARVLGLSKLFIGFVILAVSTGLPELMVTIHSLFTGTPQLSVGAIIGSNFADIALALGISAAFIGPIAIIVRDYYEQMVMFFISSLVMVFIFISGSVTKLMGFILLAIYVVGIAWLWKITHNESHEKQSHEEKPDHTKNGVIGRLILYLFLVVASSKLCVDNALEIAQVFDLPLDILGVSVFAVGTSLPEISLNIQAVRTKNYSLALGNSLGSIFSQGAFILGLLAALSPMPLSLENMYAIIPFMLASYILVGYHLVTKKSIGKISGWLLIGSYGAFIAYQIWILA